MLETEIIAVAFDGLAGAIHRPVGEPNSGVAVVICGPVGREARCAYRPLYQWAETLAGQGFSVLRYDHRGEGDSLGLDPDADQWPHWLEGLAKAAEFTRAHTGAQELVIAGLRIGATLALAAAEAVRPDGLMLLAPLPTGEAWLRDLKLTCAIQNAPPALDGAIEIDGLRLSPATIRSLEQVDVEAVASTWRAALLAATASRRNLAAALGRAVTTTPFEGYGALFKEPHANEAPAQLFDRATSWLEDFAAEAGPPGAARPLPEPQLAGADWIEQPVSFGPGLRGVLCLPRKPSGRQGVIFGNTAGDPRAGIGNFVTRACRALAAAGVAALRFDFRGVGESADAEAPVHVYETERLADHRAAAVVLKARGYSEIVLAGVCTGGFHAVRSVLTGDEFDRAIAINSWLIWRPGRQLDLRSETAQGRPKPSAPKSSNRVIRALSGEMDVAGALSRRLGQLWSSLRPDAYCRAVRAEIAQASRRGDRLHVVLGRGDPAMLGLESDFGLGCGWLARRRGVSVSLVRNLDHALFSLDSQAKAIGQIFAILGLDAPRKA